MITVQEWDNMTMGQREQYIRDNNIDVKLTHNIADELTRGFGEQDSNGFWQYTCKKVNVFDEWKITGNCELCRRRDYC